MLPQTLRSLARSKGLTLVALVTLTLGIGANTAIFSVVDAIVLRALPYRDPDRIVHVSERGAEAKAMNFSWPDWLDFRARARTLDFMALFKTDTVVLARGADEPRQIAIGLVTGDFFAVLGAQPPVGRGFSADEDQPGAAPTVVLSWKLWREAFGADRDLVGKTVTLDTQPYTVVGVAPPHLDFPQGVDVWVPFGRLAASFNGQRSGHSVGRMVAHLAPGASLEQARAELEGIGRAIEVENNPGIQVTGAIVHPLHEELAGGVRPALLLLLGAVGLVLLIGCANVANLLLVRATARRRELAVRAALGASRARLVRQLLGESLLLAGAACVLGVVLAAWGTDVLVALARTSLPHLHPVEISMRVLAFAVGVSLATALVFGLLPALRASGVDPAEGLKEGAPEAARSYAGARQLLITAEVALAVVLLVGASLLLESFRQVARTEPGFQADKVFTVKTSLPGAKYHGRDDVRRFADELAPRLAAIPGVTAAALADIPPLSDDYNQMGLEVEGTPARSDDPGIDTSSVSPGYFGALGIPLRAGRAFVAGDGAEAPPVAIIDELMARRLGGDPVGRRFRWRQNGAPWTTIVGVVGSVKAFGLDAAIRPQLYVPFAQRASWNMSIVLRSPLPPATLAAAAAAAVRAVDPGQPVFGAAMMDEIVDGSVAGRRFNTVLLGIFAALALVLAAIGIYGVVSFLTSLRAREIAIRMALGARRRDVVRLVLGQGLAPVLAGVVIGIAGAVAAARAMAGMLYGVAPLEPAAFAGTALFLVVVAAAATLVPARRASRIEPMAALRRE